MIQSFKGMVPVIDPSAYVHLQATVIGHVTIGRIVTSDRAVLRGDWGRIVLEAGLQRAGELCGPHVSRTTVHLAKAPMWDMAPSSMAPRSASSA